MFVLVILKAEVLVLSDSSDWGVLIAEKLGLRSRVPFRPIEERQAAVAVVMASSGYPYGEGEKDPEKLSLSALELKDAKVFAAAVGASEDDHLLTGRGRVLTVVGSADDLDEARKRSLRAVQSLSQSFKNAQFRKDIAKNV